MYIVSQSGRPEYLVAADYSSLAVKGVQEVSAGLGYPSARSPDSSRNIANGFSPNIAKGRSVTRAFRFPDELERQLIAEAAREKISVNRLATRILEDNLAAGAVRKKLGWMELPQMLWSDLIKATQEDERDQIARSRGIELTKQILINLYGHAAPDTFLRFLPELGNFLTPASVEVSANRQDYRILVLHAGAGIGFAKFISAMVLASVEYFLHVKAIAEYSEIACSIKFKTRLDPYSRSASNSPAFSM